MSALLDIVRYSLRPRLGRWQVIDAHTGESVASFKTWRAAQRRCNALNGDVER